MSGEEHYYNGILAWWKLPQSTSTLDQWSDQALRLAQGQWFLAGARFMLLYRVDNDVWSRRGYEDEVMSTWKVLAALPPVLLPMASCFPQPPLRLRAQSTDESYKSTLRPSVFTTLQVLNLIVCTLLTSYDYIHVAMSFPFWLSLIFWSVPAIVGPVYGLVGLRRLYFPNQLYLRYRLPDTNTELYQDDVVEEGSLEQVYQLQQQQQYSGDSPIGRDLIPQPNLDCAPVEGFERQDTTYESVSSPTLSLSTRDASQSPSTTPFNSTSTTRFRWQDSQGIRSRGHDLWAQIFACSSMLIFWRHLNSGLFESAWSSDPEMRRNLILATVAPLVFAFLSKFLLLLSLRYPRFALICTTFCLTTTTAIIWTLVFIDCLMYSGSTIRGYAVALLAFVILLYYVLFTYTAVNMEWTPEYNSLIMVFNEIKRRGL